MFFLSRGSRVKMNYIPFGLHWYSPSVLHGPDKRSPFSALLTVRTRTFNSRPGWQTVAESTECSVALPIER